MAVPIEVQCHVLDGIRICGLEPAEEMHLARGESGQRACAAPEIPVHSPPTPAVSLTFASPDRWFSSHCVYVEEQRFDTVAEEEDHVGLIVIIKESDRPRSVELLCFVTCLAVDVEKNWGPLLGQEGEFGGLVNDRGSEQGRRP
jgi:hypothetical protein